MDKISLEKYEELVTDPSTTSERILELSVVKKTGDGGFDFVLVPNPDKVQLTKAQQEQENAMQLGNAFCKWRRQRRFERRIDNGSSLPVLVSEGDSWFQFPFLVKEVVDQLDDEYLIWSIGAAGDTAKNIVKKREYIEALDKQRSRVKGFLFSAAGNDIIGEDEETGRAVLLDTLKDYNGDDNDVIGHINLPVFQEKLDLLEENYGRVIEDIRSDADFETLPIFIHGYDYPFPFPWLGRDDRNPIYADKNQWLGLPLDRRNILNKQLRREIVKYFIDSLYEMLNRIAGDSSKTQIWLIDCRNAMPDVTDWKDEIHGTSDGFKKIAARFSRVIKQALGLPA